MSWFWNTFFANRAPAWSAAAAIVLTVFSGLLYLVNKKLADTSITSQRAFLSWAGPIIINDIQNKKFAGIKVYYVIVNSGTTPARAAVSEWNYSLGQGIPEKGLDFDSLPQSERLPFVLSPKGNIQVIPISIPAADLEVVAGGQKHLFFWGWTTYHDVFSGKIRLSEFCTDISELKLANPNLTDPTQSLSTINPPCRVHNCYDEDCEDYSRRMQ